MNNVITRITKLIKSQNKYFCNCSQLKNFNLKPPWNILFFGTDEFSVASLKALHGEFKKGELLSNLEVVTSIKNKKNPVEIFAWKEKLMIHSWPISPSNCAKFHIGLVVSFGHLIPENIINKFPLGMLNVHASLLPRWRGAAPIIYAIANGDNKTGITVMKVKPHKFDVGEIVSQTSIDIPYDMNMRQLYNSLAHLGAQTLVGTFQDLVNNLNCAIAQPQSGVTFAPRVNSVIACIEWNKMSARDVYNRGRALTGMFNLTTTFHNIPVKLYDIAECGNRIASGTHENNKIVPGFIIYNKESKTLQIQCADGKWISVEKIGIPGKKMSATDFNNGFIKKHKLEFRIFR